MAVGNEDELMRNQNFVGWALGALALSACGQNLLEPPVAAEESERPSIPEEALAATSDDGVAFFFGTTSQGAAVLTAQDEYTRELQVRELAIRAQDASVTSFDGLKPVYAGDVQPWTAQEKAALREAILAVMDRVNLIDQHLPPSVMLTKTGSVVEGGLPHTRADMIVFAGGDLPQGGSLKSLFLHELHHVMTRANPDLHNDYYRIIGFEPCTFTEPEALRRNRLTNPDAPTYKHVAPVEVGAGNGVIPYLYATRDFDGGGSLGEYFGFGLLPVKYDGGVCTALTDNPDGLVAPPMVPAFGRLIGANTGYIIHPEETLADNFVYWAMERGDLPDPDIPAAVGEFWTQR